MRRTIDWRRWRRRLIAGTMVVTLAVLAGVAVFTYLAYQRAAVALVVERDHQVAYLSAARLTGRAAEVYQRADVACPQPGHLPGHHLGPTHGAEQGQPASGRL